MHFDFPTFLVLACAVTGLIWLVDALMFAPGREKRLAEAEGGGEEQRAQPKEPILVEYSRSFFPIILIVLLLRSFLVEPFRIPSGSMMPTLLIGDFILVNKFAYGLRLPVLNEKVLELGEPKVGDVVVFRYPQNPSIDYIKRVVAEPGDEIFYYRKQLFVNRQPILQTPLGTYRGEGSGSHQTGALQAEEDLLGSKHQILVNPMAPDLPPGCAVLARGPVIVPAGHYFVMGDNRDNSNDSRCWGLVPDKNLVGKAFAIWMHWDSGREGFPVAWGRLGDGIY